MRIKACSSVAVVLLASASLLPTITTGLSSSDPAFAGRGRSTGGSVPKLSSSAMTELNTDTWRRRKQRVASAPLVDSTLLRFVSGQKRRQAAQLISKQEETNFGDQTLFEAIEDACNIVSSDIERPLVEKPSSSSASSSPTIDSEEKIFLNSEAALGSLAAIIEGEDQLDPWVGQYNRHRVAQKLVALGADTAAAAGAGEIVQSHALIRTTRRRIRIFLRERDSLWNKPGEEDALTKTHLQKVLESKVMRLGIPRPNYGFGDVLDLMVEFGLTGSDICAILTHSPGIALMMPRQSFAETAAAAASGGDEKTESSAVSSSGETLEETLRRSFTGLLQETLGLRRYDARKVLRTCPRLLSVKGSKSAVQVVTIMTKLGVSANSIARDKAALPIFLSRPPPGLFRLISFLSSEKVRMPLESIGPLIRKSSSREILDAVTHVPRLRQKSQIESSEGDAVDPYVEQALWGRTREERVQQINDVYRNMATTVSALRSVIGEKDLGKLISAYPSVLLLNAEEQILPIASYLVEELDIWGDELPSVLQQCPTLLGKDLAEIKKVAGFLSYLGVLDDDMGPIIRAFPSILTLDIETKMAPVVECLIEMGVTDMGAFVTNLPPVLGYSVEKELKPKWEYLQKVCLQPKYEINSFPAYFSYPFERVTRMRYDYLAAKGIARQLIPIDAVVRFGDIDFATKIARDQDGGKVFLAFSKRRRENNARQKRRISRPTKLSRPETV